jgi:DNA adenine methylase
VELAARGVYALVSNSDTEFIRSLYSSAPFALHAVQASRAINSAADRRGRVSELIIANYALP